MIIICEGPDGTGKTTLAKELEVRGFRYQHNGPPENGQSLYDFYERQILACRGENVVFDRLHVGELVYGPVMRGRSLITIEQMRILNRLIFAQGARLIFCDTDDETIGNNWLKRRGKEYVDDADKLWEVIDRYRRIIAAELLPPLRMTYDYKVQSLARWLTRPGGVSAFSSCPDGVWGSPCNDFLIVGEQPGGKKDDPTRYDRAFCNLKGSSGFLNECLWEAGYREAELAFTNAKDLNGGVRDLRKLWYDRPKQVVITCGTIAHATCSRQGVPHLATEHPQYVRRFMSTSHDAYAGQLRQFRMGK